RNLQLTFPALRNVAAAPTLRLLIAVSGGLSWATSVVTSDQATITNAPEVEVRPTPLTHLRAASSAAPVTTSGAHASASHTRDAKSGYSAIAAPPSTKFE